jgi:hypothetical protein
MEMGHLSASAKGVIFCGVCPVGWDVVMVLGWFSWALQRSSGVFRGCAGGFFLGFQRGCFCGFPRPQSGQIFWFPVCGWLFWARVPTTWVPAVPGWLGAMRLPLGRWPPLGCLPEPRPRACLVPVFACGFCFPAGCAGTGGLGGRCPGAVPCLCRQGKSSLVARACSRSS